MSAAQIEAALRLSLTNGPQDLMGQTHQIERPVVFNVTARQQKPWGLVNGTIEATFTQTVEGITIDVKTGGDYVRYFTLNEVTLPGIKIEVNEPNTAFYDFDWYSVMIRKSRRHGVWLYGDVFEATLFGIDAEAPGDAIRMESAGSGNICSAINLSFPRVRDSGRGIVCEGWFRDCQVDGGYIGHCRGPGAYFSNGMSLPWVIRMESNSNAVADAQLVAANNVRLNGGSIQALRGMATASVRLHSVTTNPSHMIGVESKGVTPGFVDGIGTQTVTKIGMRPWTEK